MGVSNLPNHWRKFKRMCETHCVTSPQIWRQCLLHVPKLSSLWCSALCHLTVFAQHHYHHNCWCYVCLLCSTSAICSVSQIWLLKQFETSPDVCWLTYGVAPIATRKCGKSRADQNISRQVVRCSVNATEMSPTMKALNVFNGSVAL